MLRVHSATGLFHRLPMLAACTLASAFGGCYAGNEPESESLTKNERNQATQPAGNFEVRLIEADPATGAPASTGVFGMVTQGAEPKAILWHVIEQDGPCSLLEPEAPFCEVPCGSAAVCTAENECTPYPEAGSVGNVYLSGLSKREIEMQPDGGHYAPDSAPLAFPPCAEGDAIGLRADGAGHGVFALSTRCIQPLEVAMPESVEDGHDLTLRWSRAGDFNLARIRVRVALNHRGGSRGAIECDAEDRGALTIPSALVDGLIDLGLTGLPTITLTRFARSERSDDLPGVTLTMLHSVERMLAISGR